MNEYELRLMAWYEKNWELGWQARVRMARCLEHFVALPGRFCKARPPLSNNAVDVIDD